MSNRMKSWVWNYATLATDKKKAICNLCDKEISYSNSPSAIANHLTKIHKRSSHESANEQLSSDSPQNLSSTSATFIESSTKSDKSIQEYETPRKRKRQNDGLGICSVQRQETITEAITKLISTNLLPICLVSSSGFRDFMNTIEPGYKVPCDQTIVRRLDCYYQEVKHKIKAELSNVESVALTTDEWSSRAQDSYLSVEAQYIDINCEMHHVTLCNDVFENRPTAINISEELEAVIADWNLDNKVKAIVHDSAAAIVAACDLIHQVPYNVKCNAHLLQLVVKDSLSVVPEYETLICKGRAVVMHFRKSNIASNFLAKCQAQKGLKTEKLIQSCNTRWDSQYYMFQSLINNKAPISAVLSDRQMTKRSVAQKLEITESEWEDMEKLVTLLKPFQVATTVFCSENEVTISVVRPVIKSIILNHLSITSEDNERTRRFKQKAVSSLRDRFNFHEDNFDLDITHISQFFDPRHKNLECETAGIRNQIIYHTKELLRETESLNEEDTDDPVAVKESAYSFLFNKKISSSSWQSQIQSYMAEPLLDEDMNPLEWWKNHSKKYSLIFKLALQFLAVPATSAASERTFSSAGNIVTPKRSCLKPEHVNLLTFLYQNRDFLKTKALDNV